MTKGSTESESLAEAASARRNSEHGDPTPSFVVEGSSRNSDQADPTPSFVVEKGVTFEPAARLPDESIPKSISKTKSTPGSPNNQKKQRRTFFDLPPARPDAAAKSAATASKPVTAASKPIAAVVTIPVTLVQAGAPNANEVVGSAEKASQDGRGVQEAAGSHEVRSGLARAKSREAIDSQDMLGSEEALGGRDAFDSEAVVGSQEWTPGQRTVGRQEPLDSQAIVDSRQQVGGNERASGVQAGAKEGRDERERSQQDEQPARFPDKTDEGEAFIVGSAVAVAVAGNDDVTVDGANKTVDENFIRKVASSRKARTRRTFFDLPPSRRDQLKDVVTAVSNSTVVAAAPSTVVSSREPIGSKEGIAQTDAVEKSDGHAKSQKVEMLAQLPSSSGADQDREEYEIEVGEKEQDFDYGTVGGESVAERLRRRSNLGVDEQLNDPQQQTSRKHIRFRRTSNDPDQIEAELQSAPPALESAPESAPQSAPRSAPTVRPRRATTTAMPKAGLAAAIPSMSTDVPNSLGNSQSSSLRPRRATTTTMATSGPAGPSTSTSTSAPNSVDNSQPPAVRPRRATTSTMPANAPNARSVIFL
jgi:hypothetical protein